MAPPQSETTQVVQPAQRPRAASPASKKDKIDAGTSDPVVKSNEPATKMCSPVEGSNGNFVKRAWNSHRRALACVAVLMLMAVTCLVGAQFGRDELTAVKGLIGAKEAQC